MPSAPHPVLNCYLDDDGRDLVVVEQVNGKPLARRVRAPYATFHRAADVDDALMRMLKRSEHVRSVEREGEGWIRVAWRDDYARKQARAKFREIGVECYEGDVDPEMLWLVENRARIAQPRRCSLDFETDSRVPLSRKQDMRVLSWAVTDYATGQTARAVLEDDDDDAEAELLQRLVHEIDRFDQVLVWEGDWKGGEFDTFIFEARTRRTGLNVDPRRWIWLNQLAVWKKMNSAESGAEKESFKLEDIAFEQLGLGKEKAPEWVIERFGEERCARGLGGLAWDLWDEGGEFRDLLLSYNARDAEILHQLEKKKGYVALFHATCELCGIPPNTRGLQPTRQMDGYLLRLGRSRNHRFPTRAFREDTPEGEEEKGQFKGAVVFHPKSVPGDNWTKEQAAEWRKLHGFKNGILQNVHVCDFKSLYPSVMRTYNLSADAVAGWMTEREFKSAGRPPEGMCRSPGTGLLTRTDPIGFLPLALRDLMNERQQYAEAAAKLAPGTPEWIDMMGKSNSRKVTANSFYGGGGSKFSRYNHRDVSEACTQNGVHFLKLTADEGEKRKMVLVYGDTDSNMVIGPTEDGYRSFVKWMNDKRIPAEAGLHGCRENFVELAFEKTFSRIVFVSAKAYVGRYSQYKGTRAKADSEPEIKGVAWKRGDKGKLTRELQGRIIDLLVGGVRLKDASGKKVPANPGIETPTEDLAIYRAVLEAARNHVLCEPLPVAEVRLSKALSKSLREYGKDASEAHVRVARVLEERGQKMTRGQRVEYVVVDGSKSPQLVIPAEDYTGECDRFYLWERVYEPSKSLLAAAFPDEDWEEWGDVRPKAPRGKAAKVADEQLGLMLLEGASARPATARNDFSELAVPGFSVKPLIVRIPESAGTAGIDRVKAVLEAHPGARPVELVVALNSGAEAHLRTPMRVSPSAKLRAAVEAALVAE